MRQVPEYAVIGSGRMAKHFCHYLQLLNIPFISWSRSDTTALEYAFVDVPRVCVLISDSAIESFIQQHDCLKNKIVVHFSGGLTIDSAIGAHPLGSYSEVLFDIDTYQRIPFVIENSQYGFADLFPGLPNPHYTIERSQRALYHALCVLSGNFTFLLWDKVFREFENTLKLPREIAQSYMQTIFLNLVDPKGGLTGPLSRNDTTTINTNLQALGDDPYAAVYRAFIAAYQREKNI